MKEPSQSNIGNKKKRESGDTYRCRYVYVGGENWFVRQLYNNCVRWWLRLACAYFTPNWCFLCSSSSTLSCACPWRVRFLPQIERKGTHLAQQVVVVAMGNGWWMLKLQVNSKSPTNQQVTWRKTLGTCQSGRSKWGSMFVCGRWSSASSVTSW